MTEKLVVRHLRSWFGKTRALRDINLGIAANRVTAESSVPSGIE